MRACWARVALIVAFLAGLTGAAFAAQPEKRVALVIGNNDYQNFVTLNNPVNDAENLHTALESINFDVVFYKNTTLRAFYQAIKEFNKRAKDAGVALVYYAGHAVQFKGKNYLIQVDDDAETLDDINIGSVPVDKILDVLSAVKGVKVLILDACRNNPAKPTASAESARSIGQELSRDVGLSRLDDYDTSGGGGMFVAYATSASHVALDGQGANSPYNIALVKWITAVDLTIPDIFTNVTGDVVMATNQRQHPIFDSSLTGKYILNPAGSEWVDWTNVKDSTDVDKLQRFLDAHPDSAHAPQVKQKLEILQQNLAETEWGRLKDGADLAALNAFRGRHPRSPHTAEADRRIAALEEKARDEARETQAFERAKAANDIETLQAFRAAYPNSSHFSEIDRRIAELARANEERRQAEAGWERVKDTADISALQAFLRAYLGSPHEAEAAQKIAKLLGDQQREAEWGRVRDSNDAPALQGFLERYPNSPFAAEAGRKLVEAQQKAETQRSEEAWGQVKTSFDIAALGRFIVAYPNSSRAAEAKQRIVEAQERSENAHSEKEWDELKDSPDVDKLQGFRARFPHSPHEAEARQRIIDLQRSAANELDEAMAWGQAKRSNKIDELSTFKFHYSTSPHVAEADQMIAALRQADQDKKRQDGERQRKQAEIEKAKVAEAACKQEAADVADIVKSRSVFALEAMRKAAACPKNISAIDVAIRDIQAQDCASERVRVRTVGDLATLRSELGAFTCDAAAADAHARIAFLENEAKRAEEGAAAIAKACEDAKSEVEDRIDPLEPRARDQLLAYQKRVDCPAVVDEVETRVKEIDERVSSAQALLAKFGCYTEKAPSDRFDRATQEALGRFLRGSHLPGDEARLTPDIVQEMRGYTDTGVCPSSVRPLAVQATEAEKEEQGHQQQKRLGLAVAVGNISKGRVQAFSVFDEPDEAAARDAALNRCNSEATACKVASASGQGCIAVAGIGRIWSVRGALSQADATRLALADCARRGSRCVVVVNACNSEDSATTFAKP